MQVSYPWTGSLQKNVRMMCMKVALLWTACNACMHIYVYAYVYAYVRTYVRALGVVDIEAFEPSRPSNGKEVTRKWITELYCIPWDVSIAEGICATPTPHFSVCFHGDLSSM